MTAIEPQSRLSNPLALIPELKDIGGALYKATGNGTIPQTTISLVQLRAGQLAGSTYLTVLHTGGFFLPLALIGKPLPGVSPSDQWRQL
ncbi:hypothetical protein [Nonomuraea sp. NPDC050540]|uniref:hypothetical protein n=1 Tax=Nonomuraea sp. NPDC050540 TaxID=3364367 RepID=UPI0037922DE9